MMIGEKISVKKCVYGATLLIAVFLAWNLLYSDLSRTGKVIWFEIVIGIGFLPILESRWPKISRALLIFAMILTLVTFYLYQTNQLAFLI